jgi:hypothetical protein
VSRRSFFGAPKGVEGFDTFDKGLFGLGPSTPNRFPLHAPAATAVPRGAIPGNVPPTHDLGIPQTRGRPLRVHKVGARPRLINAPPSVWA